MSWGLVAVAGATVVGSVVSSKSAAEASAAAGDAETAQLQFAMQQYEDWQSVYGPIQESLSDYYMNLTPESYAAQGLEAYEKEYTASMERLDQTLAQRGIDPSSGVALALEKESEIGAAEARASIRASAEDTVQAQKAGFLSMGLGTDPSASVSQVLASSASRLGQEAAYAGQAAGQAWSSAIPAIGSAINAYSSSGDTTGYTTPEGYYYNPYFN